VQVCLPTVQHVLTYGLCLTMSTSGGDTAGCISGHDPCKALRTWLPNHSQLFWSLHCIVNVLLHGCPEWVIREHAHIEAAVGCKEDCVDSGQTLAASVELQWDAQPVLSECGSLHPEHHRSQLTSLVWCVPLLSWWWSFTVCSAT